MMPNEYFNKKNTNTNTNIPEGHRDRDTSVLVTDEQLQREFFRDNRDREIESEEDGEYSKMKERLLLLLPSLRTTTNANNNKRLVEDLLFRVGLERVSSRLLSMRKIFPTCDVAEMASKNPKVYLNFSSSNSSSDSKIERGAEEDKREDAKSNASGEWKSIHWKTCSHSPAKTAYQTSKEWYKPCLKCSILALSKEASKL